VCAAIPNFRHAEWFADHVAADAVLFDGVIAPSNGGLRSPTASLVTDSR
jgi:hypothetical protein